MMISHYSTHRICKDLHFSFPGKETVPVVGKRTPKFVSQHTPSRLIMSLVWMRVQTEQVPDTEIPFKKLVLYGKRKRHFISIDLNRMTNNTPKILCCLVTDVVDYV